MANIRLTGGFNGSYGHVGTLILDLTSASNIAANQSSISYSLKIQRNQATTSTYKVYTPVSVTINGQVFNSTVNFNITGIAVGGIMEIASGSTTAAHNADGTKIIACAATMDLSGTSMGVGTLSGNFTLDTIPRYVNTSLKNTGTYLNRATFSFTADADYDDVYIHVFNSGGQLIQNYNAGKISSFTVSSLSPNTAYSVEVDVRRTGTTLYKVSNKVSITTKAIAAITNNVDFTLGNNLPVSLSNPSGVSMALKLVAGTSQIMTANIGNVSSYTIALSAAQISKMYQLIPNATSGSFTLTVSQTYNGTTYTSSKTGTFKANANSCKPAIMDDAISFVDSNNIAGGNIIQGKSSVKVSVNKDRLTAKNSASVKNITITYNGQTCAKAYSDSNISHDFGIPQTEGPSNISLTITDSRGYVSSTAVKSVTVHPYSMPSISVSLPRVNGYEDNITLDIKVSVAKSTGFTNNIKTCTYIRNETKSNEGTPVSISAVPGNIIYNTPILNFDHPPIEKSYWYYFKITDQLDSAAECYVFVPEGKPALIIAENGTVGIGAYVDDGYKCQVGGDMKVEGRLMISDLDCSAKLNDLQTTVDAHTHDDRYYTETEINNKITTLNNKFNGYLPLAGGTMTGHIIMPYNKYFYLGGNGKGYIYSPGNQQIQFRASNETSYILHYGVVDNQWALNPNTNAMLSLGTSNHRWSDLYLHGVSYTNGYCFNNGWLLSNIDTNTKSVSIGYGAYTNKYATMLYGKDLLFVTCDNSGTQGTIARFFRESSGGYRTIFRPNANGGGYLGSDGYRWNTGYFTNTITQSDRKTKNDIHPIEKATEFIMSLKPYMYTLKNSDSNHPRTHMGLISQDVSETAKKLQMGDLSLYQAAYIDENGDEFPYSEDMNDENLSWGLNYNELIAPIIAVIQNQQAEINQLKEIIKNHLLK